MIKHYSRPQNIRLKTEYRNETGNKWDQESRVIILDEHNHVLHTTDWLIRRLSHVAAEAWLSKNQ